MVVLLLLQTLDKVLQAVQAAQAAQAQAGQMVQQTAAAGATVQESALISRCAKEGQLTGVANAAGCMMQGWSEQNYTTTQHCMEEPLVEPRGSTSQRITWFSDQCRHQR
jgi:hypothetical protein